MWSFEIGDWNSPFLTNRKFLKMVCDVPEPGERFNMDEYSEMVILNKPVVYISIGELINSHKVWLVTFSHSFVCYSFVYVFCMILCLLYLVIAYRLCLAAPRARGCTVS